WMNVGLSYAFDGGGGDSGGGGGGAKVDVDSSLTTPNNDASLGVDTNTLFAVVVDTPKITGAAKGWTSEVGSTLNEWGEAGQGNTRINNEIDSSQWLYNPYKSIHYAKACLCVPGMIYNYKKLRQIKCMEIKCI
ncbi:hypothetical protein J4209_03995, partial [Candidatus Woesearchaeota archaeon]|nr:hypothetical protein [Candidatus Woesearchaeota archaeon]